MIDSKKKLLKEAKTINLKNFHSHFKQFNSAHADECICWSSIKTTSLLARKITKKSEVSKVRPERLVSLIKII